MFAHALAVNADGNELSVGTLDQGVRRVALGTPGSCARLRLRWEKRSASAQRVDQFLPVPGTLLRLADGKLARATGWRLRRAPSARQTLTDRNVSALAFDDKGALFVGYFDRGLDVLANGAVTHFEDDSLFCVNRLALDPRRQTMAAATANGLVLFDARARRGRR